MYVFYCRRWGQTIHSGVPRDMQLLVLATQPDILYGCTTLTTSPHLIPGQPGKNIVLHTCVSETRVLPILVGSGMKVSFK